MSSVVTLDAYALYSTLNTLTPIMPKGSSCMPLGLHMQKGILTIVCIQGVVYQAKLEVNDELAVGNATIMYHDISSIIPKVGELSLEFTQSGVTISCDEFEASFSMGYSAVEEQDFSTAQFSPIKSSSYVEGLRRILNMNLEKLYNTIAPIAIHSEISLQRFQNVWVQVRSIGLSFDALLDSEHVKLLTKFVPKEVCTSVTGTLIFRNSKGILQVPCSNDNESGQITDLMKDLGEPVTVNVSSYLERVRQASKVNPKSHCKITLYKEGVKTTVSHENTNISLVAGKASNEVLAVTQMPMQVWLTFLRGLDSDVIQVLAGGGKICLRTQSTIIIARALL